MKHVFIVYKKRNKVILNNLFLLKALKTVVHLEVSYYFSATDQMIGNYIVFKAPEIHTHLIRH